MNITKLTGAALATIGVMMVSLAPSAQAQLAVRADSTPLSVGATAPNIVLPDQNGKVHKLAADKGSVVLLAFYPADFTKGCTLEAHSLSSAYSDLKALGVKVYGVSVQDPKSHEAFCTKEGIPYTLLADTKKTAAKEYGVLNEAHGVANRVTFIIAPTGKIAYVDSNVNSHLATCGEDWVAWVKTHPQPAKAAASAKLAPKFTLPNALTGAQTSLSEAMAGKKAVVVMFVSALCPICASYHSRILSLAKEYAPKGVGFLAINSNRNEPLAELKAHARGHKYPFPVLKDATDKTADAYDARVTPEAYVIDSHGALVYHGRIDNNFDPALATTHDLANALDSLLAGKPIAKPRTKAFGCAIARAA